MNCKKCQTPLEEGQYICPKCGLDNREPEKPPVNGKKLALVIGVAVLIVAVVGLIVWSVARPTGENNPTETTGVSDTSAPSDPTEATVSQEDLASHPVLNRDSYVCQDPAAAMSQVAVTMEGASLTNGQLSVWYWQTYYDLLNSLGYYASLYGLDTTKPLDQQTCTLTEVPMTWEQFLLEQTVNNYQSYMALRLEAEKANITLSQENQATLDGLEDSLSTAASQYGYDSAEAMLQADYGAGVTLEDYKEFLLTLMLGDQYYQEQVLLLKPTEQEVSDYYTENQDTFTEKGILRDGTPATIDVRHILLQPEEEAAGTDDSGSKVYTEEQMKEARAAAQDVLDQWLAGEKTEDNFGELAKAYSADGSSSAGGLYKGVTPGQMVPTFNDWCFDPARQPGDYGLVETQFGVHVMYFVKASETEYWYSTAEQELLSQRQSDWVASVADAHPVETNYQVLWLAPVDTGSAY